MTARRLSGALALTPLLWCLAASPALLSHAHDSSPADVATWQAGGEPAGDGCSLCVAQHGKRSAAIAALPEAARSEAEPQLPARPSHRAAVGFRCGAGARAPPAGLS